jgi:hypothetical protein
MGRNPQTPEAEELREYLRSGRDEMNLLEHSISGADKKPDMATPSLSFASEDRHPETGEPVERRWKVTFSAEYGRPTPKDDDVFVALLKVSQQAGLMESASNKAENAARVHFSTYQLIRILGWPDNGNSYKAVDDALNRIGGVWIVANNFWWDNAEKEFVDRKFGIIDDVFLYERDKYDRALKRARAEGKQRPLSWLRWSDVMLDSFRSGYVRKLDIEVYRSLEHPIARKLYRYLGKQFWGAKRPEHRISLQDLCHEKLGYNLVEKRNPRLREKIEPAIRELEERGVYGLSHEYEASYGKCEVIFKASRAAKSEPKKREPENPLLERLLKFGVDRATAQDALQRLDAERIAADIEHVEFEAKAGRVKSSKAGMLASMLKADEPFARPVGFVTKAEKERRDQETAESDAREKERARLKEEQERHAETQRLQAFNEHVASLAADEREAFDERSKRVFFYGQKYREALKAGDAAEVARRRQESWYALWREECVDGDATGSPVQRTVQKSSLFGGA